MKGLESAMADRWIRSAQLIALRPWSCALWPASRIGKVSMLPQLQVVMRVPRKNKFLSSVILAL
jgi:hypothetical protein